MLLTSSVVPGRTTQKGRSAGVSGYEDQEVPAWDSRSELVVEMLESPRSARRSLHAACRFFSERLCGGGVDLARGRVEAVEAGSEEGVCVPRK